MLTKGSLFITYLELLLAAVLPDLVSSSAAMVFTSMELQQFPTNTSNATNYWIDVVFKQF
jgi:hypothetical protein